MRAAVTSQSAVLLMGVEGDGSLDIYTGCRWSSGMTWVFVGLILLQQDLLRPNTYEAYGTSIRVCIDQSESVEVVGPEPGYKLANALENPRGAA